MLRNELKYIEQVLPNQVGEFGVDYSLVKLHERILLVQEAWLNAVFSELNKSSLERYLQFHLDGITILSDTIQCLEFNVAELIQKELLYLIDHLRQYYNHLLNWEGERAMGLPPQAYLQT